LEKEVIAKLWQSVDCVRHILPDLKTRIAFLIQYIEGNYPSPDYTINCLSENFKLINRHFGCDTLAKEIVFMSENGFVISDYGKASCLAESIRDSHMDLYYRTCNFYIKHRRIC
jgi:hypothetical protein